MSLRGKKRVTKIHRGKYFKPETFATHKQTRKPLMSSSRYGRPSGKARRGKR